MNFQHHIIERARDKSVALNRIWKTYRSCFLCRIMDQDNYPMLELCSNLQTARNTLRFWWSPQVDTNQVLWKLRHTDWFEAIEHTSLQARLADLSNWSSVCPEFQAFGPRVNPWHVNKLEYAAELPRTGFHVRQQCTAIYSAGNFPWDFELPCSA